MPKILIIGDLHQQEIFPYSSEFEDGRVDERRSIEDAIVKASDGVDLIVILGDVYNSRTNSSKTIRDFTSFLERLPINTETIIISGNHESSQDGSTALDYLKEIRNRHWVVVTKDVHVIDTPQGPLIFVPYLRRQTLGLEDNTQVADHIIRSIPKGTLGVFVHHTISGCRTSTGQSTDDFHEVVLPGKKLSKVSKRVFAGHIHLSQDILGNVHIVGSVQNNEIGEFQDKRVMVWDTDADTVTDVPLPGRKFAKLLNPTPEELEKVKDFPGLVKVYTDADWKAPEGMAEVVRVTELPKESRKSAELTDMSIEGLLKTYGEAKKIDVGDLLGALELIK